MMPMFDLAPGIHLPASLLKAVLGSLLVVLLLAVMAGESRAGVVGQQLEQGYGELPVAFIRNQGQLDDRVKFYEQGQGHATFFTDEGVYFALEQDAALLRFDHTGPGGGITGHSPQRARVNYFVGDDPDQWVSDIATYGEVVYEDVYPGIDARFYGKGVELEYDLVVAPGADPSQVVLAYEGIEQLSIDSQGELLVQLGKGFLKQRRPVIYQEIAGRRVAVDGRFRLLSRLEGHRYGFELGEYDSAYPLIIDPILGYSTYLGGSHHDYGQAIAVDTAGNAYVAGTTRSVNFPAVAAYQGTLAGNKDIVVSKLDASGSTLLYSTFLGGSHEDEAGGIAIDDSGNIYVTGNTHSSNYPVTASAFQSSRGGGDDAVLSKLDASGSSLLYSTFLGGNHQEESAGLAVDNLGNAYLGGMTESNNFPTKAAYQASRAGDHEGFVAKFDTTAAGNASLIYATYLGGGKDDEVHGIAIDGLGRVYVTGETESKPSSPFPVTASAYQSSLAGNEDAFVSRLSAAGNSLEYSSYLGGKKKDIGHAIAVDEAANVYLTGETRSKSPYPFPTTAAAIQSGNGGNVDVFVSRLDTNASGVSSLVYSTYLGGNNKDMGYGIVIDSAGNAFVTGQAKSTNPPFPVTASAYQLNNAGNEDAFLAQLNSTGDTLLYSTYLGGRKTDVARGITIDGMDNVYIAGYTRSKSTIPFPTTIGAYQTTNAGDEDGFITKFSAVLPLSIDSISLADGTVDISYSETISVSGGVAPYNWTIIAGSLPPGLSLNSSTGVVSGTATVTGSYNFTLEVTDDLGTSVSQSLSLVINETPVIGVSDIPDTTVGGSYSQTLSLSGGTSPYTWSVIAGSLPPGLNLNSATGEISGTATAAGNYGFTIEVLDGSGATASQVFSMTVNASPTLTTGSLADTSVTAEYSQSLSLSGGTAPYSWAVTAGALPAGLSLDSATGEISGMVMASGTFDFTVEVTDDAGVTASRMLSLTVNEAPVISTVTLADAQLNMAYSQTLSVSGGTPPFSWLVSSGSLPAGLSLDGASGEISGTATAGGDYSFTVQVTDAAGVSNAQVVSLSVTGAGSCVPVPLGTNVAVLPVAGITVSFPSVTVADNLCVVEEASGPRVPTGYMFGGLLPFKEITTQAVFSGPVEVCLAFNPADYGALSTLRLFHHNGTGWDDITSSLDMIGNIICGLSPGFSPFAIGEESSTAITLQAFSASLEGETMLIDWVTSSETDNWGFRLLRSESANGPFLPINDSLIPARGGPGLTMSYRYVDTAVESGKTYYYQLQDVDTKGLVTVHSAVQALDPAALRQLAQQTADSPSAHPATAEVSRPAAVSVADVTPRPGPLHMTAPDLVVGATTSENPVSSVVTPANEVESRELLAAERMDETDDRIQATVKPRSIDLSNKVSTYSFSSNGSTPKATGGEASEEIPASPRAFSVSIEDAKGNVIEVSRGEAWSTSVNPTELSISTVDGQTRLSWQVSGLSARGFALYRTETGSQDYRAVVDYIPNYADGGKGLYRYQFDDRSANSGKSYHYRLEVLNWGLQATNSH